MTKDTGATKPDFYNQFVSLRDRDIAKKAKVTEEEMALYSMSKSKGWQIFNNTVKNLLEELDGMNMRAIEGGTISLEEIGKNTLIINYTKGIINRLMDKVNDVGEAVESK
jgi:hypothetical protein